MKLTKYQKRAIAYKIINVLKEEFKDSRITADDVYAILKTTKKVCTQLPLN